MKRPVSPAVRRLVLGTAFAAALAAWLVPHTATVRAAPSIEITVAKTAESKSDAAATAPGAGKSDGADKTAKPGSPDANAPAPAGKGSGAEAAPDVDAPDAPGADITIDKRGIRVEKGKKHVTVQAFGSDREYDSFESFVQDAPWLAALVFLTVLLVFLVPLLIIVLLIWYKMRKNRMLNETMLKLAEKGVVPPGEAMAALDANRAMSSPATAPLYEQARQIRARTVASDLRKGVIMIAVGLAFSLYSLLGDGEPNWIGLILLFLGAGYCVLWYMEDRGAAPRASGTPPQGGA